MVECDCNRIGCTEETTSKIKCHGDDVVLRRVVVCLQLCKRLSPLISAMLTRTKSKGILDFSEVYLSNGTAIDNFCNIYFK